MGLWDELKKASRTVWDDKTNLIPGLPAVKGIKAGMDAYGSQYLSPASTQFSELSGGFHNMIPDPIGDYKRGGLGNVAAMQLSAAQNPFTAGRQRASAKGELPSQAGVPTSPMDWIDPSRRQQQSDWWKSTEDRLSWPERVATESLVDPTSYVGMGLYGKAAGKVPFVGNQLGKAVTAAEMAPGNAVNSLLDDIGRRIGPIGGKSGRQLQREFEGTFGNLIDNLITGALERTPNASPDVILRQIENLAPDFGDDLVARSVGSKVTGTSVKGMAPFVSQDSLIDSLRRAASGATDFEGFRTGATRRATEQYNTARRLGRDVELANANPIQRAGMQAGDWYADKVAAPLGKANSTLAKLILGNPAFPISSFLEDTGVALAGRGSGGRASVDDVANLFVNAGVTPEMPEGILRGTGGASLFRGSQPSAGEGGLWKYLNGSWLVDKAGEATDPVRRQFFMEAAKKKAAADPEIFTRNIDRVANELGLGATPLTREQERLAAKYALDELAQAGTENLSRFFTGYRPESKLGEIAKTFIPFYAYESQRPERLIRMAGNFPGLATAQGKIVGQSEGGDIPMPLEKPDQLAWMPDAVYDQLRSYSYNPLAGTIFNYPAQVLDKKNYPTLSTGVSGAIEGALGTAGRGGFYPSVPANAALGIIRGMEGQEMDMESLLPQALYRPLNFATTLENAIRKTNQQITGEDHPVLGLSGISEANVSLQNVLSGNRFRDYYILKQLASWGINPDEATQEQRTAAEKQIAERMFFTELAGGVPRFKPFEEREFKKSRQDEAVKAGLPVDKVKQALGDPFSIVDENGVRMLDSATRRAIYEKHPEWAKWQQISEPLKRPEDRARDKDIRAAFAATKKIDEATQDALKALYQGVQGGDVAGTQFRGARDTILQKASAQREQAYKDYPKSIMTDEEKQAWADKTGRTLALDTPQDAAARRYYGIEPKVDPNTGLPNWTTYRQERQAMLQGLDPATVDYIQNKYPRARYTDPTVMAGEERLERTKGLTQQYMNMPMFDPAMGVSSIEEKQFREAQNYLRAAGVLDGDERNSKLALLDLFDKNPDAANAYLMLKKMLRNEDKQKFLANNPQVAWYLSSYSNPALASRGYTF